MGAIRNYANRPFLMIFACLGPSRGLLHDCEIFAMVRRDPAVTDTLSVPCPVLHAAYKIRLRQYLINLEKKFP